MEWALSIPRAQAAGLGHSSEEVKSQAKLIKGVKGLCASEYMCYYR